MRRKPKKGKQKIKPLTPTQQSTTTKYDVKEICLSVINTTKSSDHSMPSSSEECTILSPLHSSLTSESSESDFEFSPETSEQLRRHIEGKHFVSEERKAQLWKEICETAISAE